MLAVSLHSPRENERQMLFEHLDRLGAQDLLLIDRGVSFCMRVEKACDGGFACVRDFLPSGLTEQVVELRAPDRADAVDYEFDPQPTTVRLVRHVASSGKIRVLMTNPFDAVRFPASIIGDLHHQRWRIEEAFTRIKHRLALEHVTGLLQRAVALDFAVKNLCVHPLAALSQAAHATAELPRAPHRSHLRRHGRAALTSSAAWLHHHKTTRGPT